MGEPMTCVCGGRTCGSSCWLRTHSTRFANCQGGIEWQPSAAGVVGSVGAQLRAGLAGGRACGAELHMRGWHRQGRQLLAAQEHRCAEHERAVLWAADTSPFT